MKIKAILLGAVSAVTLATSMQASAWFDNESYFVECFDAKNNRPIFFEWAYSRTELSQVKAAVELWAVMPMLNEFDKKNKEGI